MKTKTIRIKKKGGGTRLQKVRVLASGKLRFMKNPSKVRKSNPKPKRGGRKTTVRRRRGRRRFGFKRPERFNITLGVGIVSGPGMAIKNAVLGGTHGDESYGGMMGKGGLTQEGLTELGEVLGREFTGFSPREGDFRWERLIPTYGPLVIAGLVSKGLSMLGIKSRYNRATKRIPLLNKTTI